MGCVRLFFRALGGAAALLAFAACGAGLITGVASSSRGNPQGEARAPELSLDPLLPLVPAPNTTRTVVVANAQIAAAARLRVRIDAAGVGRDQIAPTVSGQGGSTLIGFTLETGAIAAAVGDVTANDVQALLTVFVDDRPIAPPAPILLVRQPRASLVLPASEPYRFLSPIGERVQLRLAGLRSTEPSELQLLVTTVDATRAPEPGQPQPTVTRLCTDLRIEPPGNDGVPIVSAIVPGNPVPVQALLFVRDAVAGQSTTIENAFYRPDIAVALPSQGPTTGGSLVTLIGTALVPLDPNRTGGVPGLLFDAVELSFSKGGRRSVLPREDFRVTESGTDRLVFTMPASPDGRPGQVDVNLRVQIGNVPVQITASQVFLFANPKPFFGPRGAVLDRTPVAVVPLFLDAEPGQEDTATPDFAVLTDQGGVGFLQVLLSQQNGMFQPFAAPRRIGDHEVADERGPRDICSGDFDGDHVPDLFLANAGTSTAIHHVVLGRARPDTPLGSTFRIAGISASGCRSARIDHDEFDDVLLLPSENAPPGQVPVVLFAHPTPNGPSFTAVPLPVRPLRHEAVEIADLDGDGNVDVALLRGTTLQLDVAWGDGAGGFTGGVASQLDFSIAGYVPDPKSPAVGLHACRNGPQQSLGFVLAGLPQLTPPAVSPTQPAIGILPQPSPRVFVAPLPDTTGFAPTEPFGQSLVADLDKVPPVELVVSVAGNPALISLAVVRFDPDGWRALEGGVEIGADEQRQIRELHFGRAFAPTADVPEASAVFMIHESVIDGETERRLSTRLVFSSGITLRVLPPDAGAIIPGEIGSIVGGNFHPVAVAGQGRVRDLALGQPDAIQLVQNDGYGGFPRPTTKLQWAGLRQGSVALLPSAPGVVDRIVFIDANSRIGIWQHDPNGPTTQVPQFVSAPLRDVVPNQVLTTLPVSDATRIRVADVDGDGADDLVVLLRFVGATGENGAAVALLRGKANPATDEFPFQQPTTATLVHANASSLVLGDFAATTSGPMQLELAVAVPTGTTPGAIDGDHVRFFRYRAGAAPAADGFEPSAIAGESQVLLAGDGPTQLAAADLDRDGLVDLLVACAGDNALRLFRNVSLPQPAPAHVDIESFVESLSSPRPMSPGTPTALHLSDVNGDNNVDAVVTVEFTSAVTSLRSTSVAFYLSSGSGDFSLPQFVSPERVGDRDRRLASAIGDFNRDGIQDLLLAWPSIATGDRNVRVLFGGTR